MDVNERQKRIVAEKLYRALGVTKGKGSLTGYTIAIWGLSFKPNTDDIREAPSLVVISELLDQGATIRAYDPVAMEKAEKRLGKSVHMCNDAYEAVTGADALALMTEWNEFRMPDFERMKELMHRTIIVDGRNLFDADKMKDLGFIYSCIGKNA
jgi:UDPglucose 6-dehydrogenase